MHQRLLILFRPEDPLEFLAMEILGPLPKTRNGNRFVIFITDRFSNLTRGTPTKRTTPKHVAEVILEAGVVSHGIPDRLLTDNGPECARKLFNAACVALRNQLPTTAAYHSQNNGHTERYNVTIWQSTPLQWRTSIWLRRLRTFYNVHVQLAGVQINENDPFQSHTHWGATHSGKHCPFRPYEKHDGKRKSPEESVSVHLSTSAHLQTRWTRNLNMAQELYKANFDRRVRRNTRFNRETSSMSKPYQRALRKRGDEDWPRKLQSNKSSSFVGKNISTNTTSPEVKGTDALVSIDRLSIAVRLD